MDISDLRKLAGAVFMAAINDRNASIRRLSCSESLQVRRAYSARLKRARQELGGQLSAAREKVLLDQTRKHIKEMRTEAVGTVRETTRFLVSDSIWHEILNINPDVVRKRLEEFGIELDTRMTVVDARRRMTGASAYTV